tara:strand:- start:13 stop:231 length:219 start_codon:yes stop_codon:yes gene_type:complete
MFFWIILFVIFICGGWFAGKAIGSLLLPKEEKDSGDIIIHHHHHTHHTENHLHVNKKDLQELNNEQNQSRSR